MGRLFLITLEAEDEGNIFRCRHCQTHFALFRDSIRDIPRPSGRLYIFPKVFNVIEGEQLLGPRSRTHKGCAVEVFCVGCGSFIGLKIVKVVWPLNMQAMEGRFFFES